jgi:hemerythrin
MSKPFFEWDDALYSVGDETIDTQHQGLLVVLNRLYALVNDDSGATNTAAAAEVMHALTQYIIEHFSYEENRMQESAYPIEKIERHRAEHDFLIAKVQGFERRLDDSDPTVLSEMLPYLYGDWLIQHICVSDMDYRPFIQP